MELKNSYILDLPAKDFFDQILFNREFTEHLYLEALEMKGLAIDKIERTEERMERRITVTPQQDAPAFVRKVIRGELSYTEEGVHLVGSDTYDFKTTTSTASDRILINGRITVAPVSDDRCERTVEMSIVVKVPLLGSKLEGFVGERLGSSLEHGAVATNKWLASRK